MTISPIPSLRAAFALLTAVLCVVLAPAPAQAAVGFRNATCNTKSNAFGIPPYTITINKPAGAVTGDLLIASTRYSAFYSSVSTPTGWTQLLGNSQDSTTWYKFVTATDGASYDFTMPSGPGNASGIISAFTGVSPASPFASAGVQANSGTAASVALPDDVGTRVGSMRYSSVVSGAAVSSSWAGMTEACDINGNGLGAAGAYELTGIGTTTSRTDARSGTGAFNAQTYVLNPLGPCETGGLTLTPPGTITFPATTLDGTDKQLNITSALNVDDQSGSGAGWNLTGTSTTFTSGARTLPTTATQVTSMTPAAGTGNCTMTGANPLTYPITLPAGTTAPAASKIFTTPASSGQGPIDLTMGLRLNVPGAAHTGTYSSTWTLTLSSGP